MAEVWGPISDNGHPAKLGITTTITQTPTKVDVTVKVIFWAYHGVDDANNSFYYDIGTGVSSASTYIGKKNIYLTNGYNWTYNLKQELYSNTYSYTRGTNDVTINIHAKFAGVEYGGGTTYVNTSFTIPKLDSYTIYYYNNDGSSERRTQTKYYGQNVTFISAPSRYGYRFIGWTPNSNENPLYQPGETYSTNASLTLMAVWRPNSFTITFDANGGTGGPISQTKNYGEPLQLSSEVPRRTYFNFLGWSITKGSDYVTYKPGDSYTEEYSSTLYAVWELGYKPPRIFNAKVNRCAEDGTATDEGDHTLIEFNWECYVDPSTDYRYSVSEAYFYIYNSNGECVHDDVISDNVYGNSGHYRGVHPFAMDPDSAYDAEIMIYDTIDEGRMAVPVPSQQFSMDVLKGGNGVAFGTSAKREGVAEVAYTLKPTGNRYAMSSWAGYAKMGYIKIATIDITGFNADYPITFVLSSRRNWSTMTIHIQFDTVESINPKLIHIKYEGTNYKAYLVPANKDTSGSSKWFLYVKKMTPYDTITVQDWWMSQDMEDVCSVTFHEDAPDDAFEADIKNLDPYYTATPLVPQNVLDSFMPVGYILILYSQANPNTMYPGTSWERITEAFLWATSAGGTIGQTGGEKTHTLTIEEMPSHTHHLRADSSPNGANVVMNPASNGTTTQDRVEANSYTWPYTTFTGGNKAHNNMPPYIQVAMWRRTA